MPGSANTHHGPCWTRDIFVTCPNVTNESGIELEIEVPPADDFDSTFVLLAPYKILINPDFRIRKTCPLCCAGSATSWWGLARTRRRVLSSRFAAPGSAFSIDPKRVVENQQKSMIRALEEWGFEPMSRPPVG